jgi:hypothetical protein
MDYTVGCDSINIFDTYTVGHDSIKIFNTPGWRITSRTYSRPYYQVEGATVNSSIAYRYISIYMEKTFTYFSPSQSVLGDLGRVTSPSTTI